MGGAGKTAITDRFLQMLPGSYPNLPEVEKARDLPAPQRTLVFSFYDVPNPDSFFQRFRRWLREEVAGVAGTRPEPESATRGQASLQETLDLIEQLRPDRKLLLVLDGLEKIQDPGIRGGRFGQILDGRLRSFVIDAADGYFPAISLLITTRFWLYDTLMNRSGWHLRIDVDRLPEDRCVSLLRQRGVLGSEGELLALARDHGLHALSVDLLGGFIARFCDGKPALLPASVESTVGEVDTRLSPALAAIQEQERKLARLARWYHDALAETDPATLALLQRVCLFRLGVDLDFLVEVFTGPDKVETSGESLARLSRDELRSRLALLVEMKVLESSGAEDVEEGAFSIHPAVREGLLRSLSEDTAQLGHEAAREGLEASLGSRAESDSEPEDPRVLDLLEEIIYHTLSAGHPEDAWEIYHSRIGQHENLLWRLGQAERGDRICRALAESMPNWRSLPDDLESFDPLVLAIGWSGYLTQLGRIEAALEVCPDTNVFLNNSLPDVPSLLLLRGMIQDASSALGSRADNPDDEDLRLTRARIEALRGAEHSQVASSFGDVSEWMGKGVNWKAMHAVATGDLELAGETARSHRRRLTELYGPNDNDAPYCDLILADVALRTGELDEARAFLKAALEWAVPRDAKELLCWSALIRARLETECDARRDLEAQDRALKILDGGLRIAVECGYALHHVDLLLYRARLLLHRGDPEAAYQDVALALFEGVRPAAETGRPTLVAAADPECGYVWGIAEGRHLLAEIDLLRAARLLGRATLESDVATLPTAPRELIENARTELTRCIELRERIGDPLVVDSKRLLAALDEGKLTDYPLNESPVDAAGPAPTAADRRFRVALSFPGEHRELVAAIADELAGSLGRDRVFYDRYYEAELARTNLDTYLQRIYHDDSDLLVVFLCADYERKEWCRLEWRAIRDLIKTRRDDEVMPIRVDNGDVSGLFSIDGYIDAAGRPPGELTELILMRLELLQQIRGS